MPEPAIIQSTKAGDASTSPAATFSSTPTEGNRLLCLIGLRANAGISAAPSGWAQVDSQSAAVGGDFPNAALYTKVAGASEPTSVSATLSGSTRWQMILVETEPAVFEPAYSSGDHHAKSSTPATTFNLPALTTTVGDVRRLCFLTTAGTTGGEQDLTQPAGWSQLQEEASTVGKSSAVFTRTETSAGTFSGETASAEDAASHVIYHIGLRSTAALPTLELSGTLQGPAPTMTGEIEVQNPISGTLQAPSPAVTGSLDVANALSGTITMPGPNAGGLLIPNPAISFIVKG